MTRVKVTWTISPKAHNLISKASKHNGHSVSSIVDNLILQKLSDPIQTLTEECREHARQIHKKKSRIDELKKINGG